jgi:hypothetical protein
MNSRKTISFVTGLSFVATTAAMLLMAQEQRPAKSKGGKASPHAAISVNLNGKKVEIVYGRPYKKDRKIFGGLEPYGQVWRTGADEATTLETQGDIMLGSLHVPAGKYSLFTIPAEKDWTLIVNKVVNQWGAFKYDAKQDLGRAPMKLTKASFPTEQFTITIETKGASEGLLKMAWDDAVATIPIMMH